MHNINEELNLSRSIPESTDNLSIGEDKEDYDDKKPMIAKDCSLLTTIIGTICEDELNSYNLIILGGDLSNWRLGNIRETEDETIV